MPASDLVRTTRLHRRPRSAACLALLAGASLFTALGTARAAPSFDPELAPTGWVARPTLTSNDLKSGSESVFRADYKAGLWIGTVRANQINASGDTQTTSPWAGGDTASVLATTNWDTGRRIVTRTSSGTAVPFRWTSLDTTQQAALGGGTTGQNLVNFVRGDRTNESPNGTKLRARTTVQGDILHSTLIYWRHAGGERRLYVGGNDGMLHVFDAANGSEVFAYIPSMLVSKLPKLAVNPYVHTLFVDGALAVADTTIAGASRTLLAGALGGGGRGLFMLDVTSPTPATEAAAAALLKWEITPASTGFANLGFTYAAPKIARMNDGSVAVVVGNGYLNTGNGQASLYVINADTGALIREIGTGSGSTASPNGLSSATLVDTNNDGKVDYAYAGDIDGNLWRFDLSASASGSWTVTRLMTTSPAQAITVAPVVTRHPNGGRMVLFGTGRILTPADADDSSTFHAYGYWDGAPVTNTSWLNQSVTEVTSGGARLRTLSGNTPNWSAGGHVGWRLELPLGERVVGEGTFLSEDRFYFTSTNPTIGATASGQADGENWLMEVQFLTGGRQSRPVFDINLDGRIDTNDNVGGVVVSGKHLGEGVSSQPVLADQASFGQTLFNRASDIDLSPPTTTASGGVSGGHFDPDFYAMSGTTFAQIKHVHEYDDKYNVTGVNWLNASVTAYNLGTKLSATQNFKVLVMNQYLNPASQLKVGPTAGFVNVKTYGGMTTAATAKAMLDAQPVYNLGNIGSFVFNLPLDAFKSKDWWGDGGPVRAGLMPSTTGCVTKVNADGSTPTLGANGERHNGALTLQIIKDTTPDSAIELNYPAGGAKYGWRVKAANFTTYVLAEYTAFWHHPNGRCYGQAGWVPNPPEDTGGASKPSAAAAGSADPRDGTFNLSSPAGVTITSTSAAVSGNVVTITINYSDGKKVTTVITSNADGSETVQVTGRDGTVTTGSRMSTGFLGQAPDETLQVSRRINWREVVRP